MTNSLSSADRLLTVPPVEPVVVAEAAVLVVVVPDVSVPLVEVVEVSVVPAAPESILSGCRQANAATISIAAKAMRNR